MFTFSEFIIENVRKYVDVFEMCLTSYETVQYIKRYYVCVQPHILPFPGYILNQRTARPWEKFTNYVMSKPFFRHPSDLRLRLCALLDYLNKRQFRITTTADPRRDITIRFKNRTYARGLMTKSYPLWKSDPLAAAKLKEPFYFRMTNVAASAFTLQGIVFTEAEYSRDLDRHIILFNEKMRENDMKPIYRLQRAYVVKMQQCTHVIVFLYHKPIKEKKLMSRAKLQERLSDEEREQKEKEISDQLVQSYIDRFFRL